MGVGSNKESLVDPVEVTLEINSARLQAVMQVLHPEFLHTQSGGFRHVKNA